MSNTPSKNPQAEALNKPKSEIEKRIEKTRILLFGSGGILAAVAIIGLILTMPKTHPNQWNEAETRVIAADNKRIKNGITSKWGVKFPQGTEIKDDEWIFLEVPGTRLSRRLQIKKTLLGDEEGVHIDMSPETPQMIRMPKHCVDIAWNFNQCVQEKFRTDLRFNYGGRLPGEQARLKAEVKAGTYGSPHVLGQCVFDISFQDAYSRSPYAIGSNGELLFWEDMPTDTPEQKAEKERVQKELEASVNGMHIIAIEACGKEVGLTGGLCPGNVWRDTWHMLQGDPGECRHDDPKYIALRESLLKNPPNDLDGVRKYFGYLKQAGRAIGDAAKKYGKKALEWWTKD